MAPTAAAESARRPGLIAALVAPFGGAVPSSARGRALDEEDQVFVNANCSKLMAALIAGSTAPHYLPTTGHPPSLTTFFWLLRTVRMLVAGGQGERPVKFADALVESSLRVR